MRRTNKKLISVYKILYIHNVYVYMGKNTGRGGRIGLVKNRRQAYNPRTKKYIKIDTVTGKILKTSSTKFKGVRMKGGGKSSGSKKKYQKTVLKKDHPKEMA